MKKKKPKPKPRPRPGYLIPFLLAPLASCWGLSPDIPRAERAFHEAVAPEYLRYVEADPALTLEQKERRGRTVEAWRIFIEALEAEAGIESPPRPEVRP